jgi:hypothetical protein
MQGCVLTPCPRTLTNENTLKIDFSFVGILYLIIGAGLSVSRGRTHFH